MKKLELFEIMSCNILVCFHFLTKTIKRLCLTKPSCNTSVFREHQNICISSNLIFDTSFDLVLIWLRKIKRVVNWNIFHKFDFIIQQLGSRPFFIIERKLRLWTVSTICFVIKSCLQQPRIFIHSYWQHQFIDSLLLPHSMMHRLDCVFQSRKSIINI